MNSRRAAQADIALLLEGTYPYVTGGVSSWVDQIIRGFPERTFAIYFLGSRTADYGEQRYSMPDNVVHFEAHYLYDDVDRPPIRRVRVKPAVFDRVRGLHSKLQTPGGPMSGGALLHELMSDADDRLTLAQFLYSRESWEFIEEQYTEYCTDPSFIDYFWTVRTMYAPIFKLAEIVHAMPSVQAFHAVSTGYAGLLGAMARRRFGRPLMLTEHGIYTKERKIDLFSAQWVADNRSVFQREAAEVSYFRLLWIRFFEGLGRMCYDAADQIISLYEANRLRQVSDGAPAARTHCIPNGVNVEILRPLRASRAATPPPVLCLIGRVVPIKDVKTFIRAMRTVIAKRPDAQGWIAGPEEEDPTYVLECRALVEGLGLQGHVKFLGFQSVSELLPKVGVVVLSSISEALPLVLLEGFAAGVPAIATDVGSCRQLVYGCPGADAAIGAAGRIVGIAQPEAFARAALELLSDPAAWCEASAAAIRRVETYYTEPQMLAEYRDRYASAMGGTSESGAPEISSADKLLEQV